MKKHCHPGPRPRPPHLRGELARIDTTDRGPITLLTDPRTDSDTHPATQAPGRVLPFQHPPLSEVQRHAITDAVTDVASDAGRLLMSGKSLRAMTEGHRRLYTALAGSVTRGEYRPLEGARHSTPTTDRPDHVVLGRPGPGRWRRADLGSGEGYGW